MRKIILHIGSEKTGSTTIQNSLKANRKKLLQQKLVYPVIHDKYKSLLSLPFAQVDSHNDLLGGRSVQKLSRFMTRSLEKEFKSNHLNYIISSEFFHSRIRSPKYLEHLKIFLEKYFDNIFIICYQRDPWEKAVSLLSESIKVGVGQLSGEVMFSEYYYHACSLGYTPNMWKRVFDKHCFILLEDATRSKSLINHFYGQIGVDSKDFKPIERLNTSLSVREAKFLSYLYKILLVGKEKDYSLAGRTLKSIRRKIFYNAHKIYRWLNGDQYKNSKPLIKYFSQIEKKQWISAQLHYESYIISGKGK